MGLPENSAGGPPSLLVEGKRRSEELRQNWVRLRKEAEVLSAKPGGKEGSRVFVSAELVYLPEEAEPVQRLRSEMITKDGIRVGWKKDFNFDPADPGVKDLDPDGDGFSNLEEFLAGTDPTRKEDSPAKESKLKARANDPVAMVVSFPEKSGGSYTLRFQMGPKRKEYKGKPGDSFWVMAGADLLEIYSDETKLEAARKKAADTGKNQHAIPLKIADYQEKLEKIKDAKAGGIEMEVDNSAIILDRKDGLAKSERLLFSTPQRPRSLSWDVSEIRFFSPAGGGIEIGPFRIGETFAYEGKKFALVGRDPQDPKKILLQDLSDSARVPFPVPPENSPPKEATAP